MRKSNPELIQEWSEKIQKQTASGKSIAAWCREESISYNTFLYWHKRLQTNSSQDQVKRSSFIECPQDSDVWIEIILEGAKLTLSKNFNRASLLFCLRVFGAH
jgi:hypothetical protein